VRSAFSTLVSLLLSSLLLATGCASERASNECKDVCRKQAQCVDQQREAAGDGEAGSDQNKFDQSECVAACTALLRDEQGKKIVEQHVACIDRAGADCTALLACP
jgi:hypothetical protein